MMRKNRKGKGESDDKTGQKEGNREVREDDEVA